MAVDANKETVRRFFNDALDKGDLDLIGELFNDNCVFYRGDFDDPVEGPAGMKTIVEKRVGL
jgi:ketosteroid isomerase-like protein